MLVTLSTPTLTFVSTKRAFTHLTTRPLLLPPKSNHPSAPYSQPLVCINLTLCTPPLLELRALGAQVCHSVDTAPAFDYKHLLN